MARKTDIKGEPRIVYAQSSDIQSRSWLEYRYDMKKKAIAELEVMPWLEAKMKAMYKTENVVLKKSGGDAFVWFLRDGKVSGEPDYEAVIDGKSMKIEFQYSESEDMQFFDFKVSKIGKKIKGKRVPFEDRIIFYLIKPTNKFAFIEPKWVMQNGQEKPVPAWGNRVAFRIDKNTFLQALTHNQSLEETVRAIDKKNQILQFQKDFLQLESEKMSSDIQRVIDENITFEICPQTMLSFYKVCFILNHLNKVPTNLAMWFSYLMTFYSDDMTSYDMAQFMYSLDYLYSQSSDFNGQELSNLAKILQDIGRFVRHSYEKGLYKTSNRLTPLEECRNFSFICNLLEDTIQDAIHYYGLDIPPVKSIFSTLPDYESIVSVLDDEEKV